MTGSIAAIGVGDNEQLTVFTLRQARASFQTLAQLQAKVDQLLVQLTPEIVAAPATLLIEELKGRRS